MNEKLPKKLFGQEFNKDKLALINEIIKKTTPCNRERIAKNVCIEFDYLNEFNEPKLMSCKAALLKLHRKNIIELPEPQRKNTNKKRYQVKNIPIDETPLEKPVGKLTNLLIYPVENKGDSYLWNDLIARYHYLGFKHLVGHQKRYLVRCDEGLLGAVSFSSSAWKLKDRDDWIGWNKETQETNLHLVINNSRFLILPWIKSKNLASKILSLCSLRIAEDYDKTYGYRPLLLETFIESERFAGTCYKAANWIFLGKTKGRGRMDRYTKKQLPVKYIYVYPLVKNCKKLLGELS